MKRKKQDVDMVNHPPHYTNGPELEPLECIDFTRWMPFTLGCALKYVWRAGAKGNTAKAIEDLEKAKFYLADWNSPWFGEEARYSREARNIVQALMYKARPTMFDFFPEWKMQALDYIAEAKTTKAFDWIDKGIEAFRLMGEKK